VGRLYDATWGRGFAAYYDRRNKASERYGLEETRRELLREAGGRVLELGAGTGANAKLYPETVEDLVLVEPDRYMARRLRSNLRKVKRRTRVLEVRAEELPFESATFDTVVATLVLCTVPSPSVVLAEVARVLKPSGRFLFLEHVRAADRATARWQDRLEKPWRFLADGCYCNRDTLAEISASELDVKEIRLGQLPKSPAIVTPLVFGTALPRKHRAQTMRLPHAGFSYAR